MLSVLVESSVNAVCQSFQVEETGGVIGTRKTKDGLVLLRYKLFQIHVVRT